MQQQDEGLKLKEPDVFNGKDPAKLPIFISQCVQHFFAKPTRYANDRSRVLFAASYLRDIASAWWMPNLTRPSLIMDDWQAFTDELYTMFGNKHVQSTAQNALLNLKMKENALASEYLVQFNSHAPYTGWNDAALATAFYRGLPNRIKDGFQYTQRPQDFPSLRNYVLDFDQRHWERQEELGNKPVKSSDKQKAKDDSNKANDKEADSSSNRKKKKKKSGSNNTDNKPSTSSNKPAAGSKTTEAKTEARGPLNQAEKDRCKNEGLCMYCGEKGHFHNKCPKLANRPTTAAAATTTLTTTAATPAAPATGRATYTFTTKAKSENSQPTQEES